LEQARKSGIGLRCLGVLDVWLLLMIVCVMGDDVVSQAGSVWVLHMVVEVGRQGVQIGQKEWHFDVLDVFRGLAYVAGLSSDVVWLL